MDKAMDLLQSAKTIAVVGVSSNPSRPSHEVAGYLIEAGYTVYLVNPNEKEIFGLSVYASLRDVPEAIDIVDIFRRAEDVPPVVDDAIACKAGAVWMQLGIVNEAAAAKAVASGIEVVMNRCTKIEHQRLVAMRGSSAP
jgi:predicted CoA-binding protein